jgi:hypothetical protein
MARVCAGRSEAEPGAPRWHTLHTPAVGLAGVAPGVLAGGLPIRRRTVAAWLHLHMLRGHVTCPEDPALVARICFDLSRPIRHPIRETWKSAARLRSIRAHHLEGVSIEVVDERPAMLTHQSCDQVLSCVVRGEHGDDELSIPEFLLVPIPQCDLIVRNPEPLREAGS